MNMMTDKSQENAKKIPTLIEIWNILSNEDECIKYLQEKGCIYKSLNCPKCNKLMKLSDKMFRCNNRNCKKAQSLMTNSWFEGDKLSINFILMIYYFWINKTPVTSIATITGRSTQTVSHHINNIRNLISSHLAET